MRRTHDSESEIHLPRDKGYRVISRENRGTRNIPNASTTSGTTCFRRIWTRWNLGFHAADRGEVQPGQKFRHPHGGEPRAGIHEKLYHRRLAADGFIDEFDRTRKHAEETACDPQGKDRFHATCCEETATDRVLVSSAAFWCMVETIVFLAAVFIGPCAANAHLMHDVLLGKMLGYTILFLIVSIVLTAS